MLSTVSSFYRWCSQEQIDAESGKGFNPTLGVSRPKVRQYTHAQVLSREQAGALLAVLKQDEAILSKRDYAFFLARLRLGVALKKLQQLQWGQIETDERGTLVKWGAQEAGAPLPEDVHQAILDYLSAAGRLKGMRAEAYIFAPEVDPLNRGASGKAEDWDERRHLGRGQIKASLKKYGRLVGIPDEKLSLTTLRHTAAILRLEAGDSSEEMQAFLEHATLKYTQEYMAALPVPPAQEQPRDLEKDPPVLPERGPHKWKAWERMTHGTRVKSQPPEEIAAILAEDIRGLEEEIEGLRVLNRRLLERQSQATTGLEVALLADAYTLSAVRVAKMIAAEREFEKSRAKDSWAEEFLARMVSVAKEMGEEADVEEFREQALGGDGLQTFARRLVEEVAGTRLMLRRTFEVAMKSEGLTEQVRLTEIYGRSCNRLVKLLKGKEGEQSLLETKLQETIEQAIKELNEEWGLK